MKQPLAKFFHDRRSTLKLAATYLVVIMVMSIVFSLILYFTSVHSFEKRPIGPPVNIQQQDPDHEIDEWLGRRDADNRSELAIRLIILNIFTLFVGACFSYFLARKTLQPIENAMEEQERFIADASHELRTPLTSVLLSNEVALRKKDLKLSDARKLIEQNVGDINELKTLSDELLDVSSDTQTINKRKTSLQSVIKNVLKQTRPLAEAKHITVTGDETTVQFTTDPLILGKVLIILIDNAIKYSPENTRISLSFRLANGKITILVADQGIGIAAKDISHIFERFYRIDASRSQIGGHGLGLAIAAKLMAKLEGEISAESSLGKGSTFKVRLPL